MKGYALLKRFVIAFLLAVILAAVFAVVNAHAQTQRPGVTTTVMVQPFDSCKLLEPYGWWWFFWNCQASDSK